MDNIGLRQNLENKLKQILKEAYENFNNIVVMCIGTDRVIGDAFGPLVGYNIKKYETETFRVYGDLEDIISANNIDEKLSQIYDEYYNPFIITIDSALSYKIKPGSIIIENRGLIPGASLGKNIDRIGNVSIKGIVGNIRQRKLSCFKKC